MISKDKNLHCVFKRKKRQTLDASFHEGNGFTSAQLDSNVLAGTCASKDIQFQTVNLIHSN